MKPCNILEQHRHHFRGASILRTLELLAVLFPEASTLPLLGQSSRHTENNKFYDVLEEHKCGGAGKEAVGETAALQLFVATSQGHGNWRSVFFPRCGSALVCSQVWLDPCGGFTLLSCDP